MEIVLFIEKGNPETKKADIYYTRKIIIEPLGFWNSFRKFGQEIDDKKKTEMANNLKEKLKEIINESVIVFKEAKGE